MYKSNKRTPKYPIQVYLTTTSPTPKNLPSRTIEYTEPNQMFFSDSFAQDFKKPAN